MRIPPTTRVLNCEIPTPCVDRARTSGKSPHHTHTCSKSQARDAPPPSFRGQIQDAPIYKEHSLARLKLQSRSERTRVRTHQGGKIGTTAIIGGGLHHEKARMNTAKRSIHAGLPGTGLEPASLAALAPQASASANFATRAKRRPPS